MRVIYGPAQPWVGAPFRAQCANFGDRWKRSCPVSWNASEKAPSGVQESSTFHAFPHGWPGGHRALTSSTGRVPCVSGLCVPEQVTQQLWALSSS